MIKIENVVMPSPEQWEMIIRGMRNPMNSWDRSDSNYGCEHCSCDDCSLACISKYNEYIIGENDYDLMNRLAKGGSVHAKYRRMIVVYLNITAPLYWWKEFDTYKVGTVANSCSTMHKIHAKEFRIDDFSYEHLNEHSTVSLYRTIHDLNSSRGYFLATKDKYWWWQMIQLLPSSYNQKRTVMLNYEVLAKMYKERKDHKLDEWHDFCEWIESLPYSELIIGENHEEDK